MPFECGGDEGEGLAPVEVGIGEMNDPAVRSAREFVEVREMVRTTPNQLTSPAAITPSNTVAKCCCRQSNSFPHWPTHSMSKGNTGNK